MAGGLRIASAYQSRFARCWWTGGIKEYVVGSAHEVTDRLFVVRRAFRINDALPEDPCRAGSGSVEDGCWWIALRGESLLQACRSLILIFRRPAGTGIMRHIAGSETTERKPMRSLRNLSRRKPVLKKLLPKVLRTMLARIRSVLRRSGSEIRYE